jgi:hypothetical protein
MQYANLRDQSIEDVLNQVQGLQAMAPEGQVRSVAAIAARCAIEVGEGVDRLSGAMTTVATTFGVRLGELNTQLDAARSEMAAASRDASEQTKALVRWTKVLAFATGAYVVVSAILVAVTVLR